MGRSPCCEKAHTNKGAWTRDEDQRLIDYIRTHGEGCWRSLPKAAGLLRCGKSCRLRWINYLRPDLKRGNFTEEEDQLIIKLHSLLGNKWSLIAARLPGRTDNEIKNYWNTHIKRKLLSRGIDPQTHRPLNQAADTDAVSNAPTELDFRNVPRVSNTKSTANPALDFKFNDSQIKAKAESLEEGNSSSSGMTTDEEQQLQQDKHPSDGQELNLELSIGISSLGRNNNSTTGVSTASSAESKPRLDNRKFHFPRQASISYPLITQSPKTKSRLNPPPHSTPSTVTGTTHRRSHWNPLDSPTETPQTIRPKPPPFVVILVRKVRRKLRPPFDFPPFPAPIGVRSTSRSRQRPPRAKTDQTVPLHRLLAAVRAFVGKRARLSHFSFPAVIGVASRRGVFRPWTAASGHHALPPSCSGHPARALADQATWVALFLDPAAIWASWDEPNIKAQSNRPKPQAHESNQPEPSKLNRVNLEPVRTEPALNRTEPVSTESTRPSQLSDL
ncbi:hypothetical protein V6N13_120997 [Hibiscus sabdariffa]